MAVPGDRGQRPSQNGVVAIAEEADPLSAIGDPDELEMVDESLVGCVLESRRLCVVERRGLVHDDPRGEVVVFSTVRVERVTE